MNYDPVIQLRVNSRTSIPEVARGELESEVSVERLVLLLVSPGDAEEMELVVRSMLVLSGESAERFSALSGLAMEELASESKVQC